MDIRTTWTQFRGGAASGGAAFLEAAAAFAAAFVVLHLLVRPVHRFLIATAPDKSRQARSRRFRFSCNLTALLFGGWVFFAAVTPPASRGDRLGYQLLLLGLLLGLGHIAFEILLTLFAETIPVRRGRPPVSQFFKDVVRTLALTAVLFVALKQTFPRIDVGQLITTSAVLSLVIGLALQESLSNVFAGLMLTIDQPYKPGDWIDVGGHEGKVLDSNWRSVRVLTRDDDVIYVPNREMASHNVLNYSAPTPLHLVHRRMGVEYGAPPNRVRQVLINAMSQAEGVLKEPAPDVFLLDYADFAVVYDMRFWIDDYSRRTRIESDVMRAVWYQLKRNNISIPFPVRDVYLKREKPSRQPEEIVALLRKVDFLVPLAEIEQKMLADDLTSQLFAKGEQVCRQGEEGSTFYIIKSGKVSVHVKGSDGVEAEVAQLGPGAYFGEMSLLTGEPRTSTVKAAEDCELLSLDRESFGVLLRDNPPVAQIMSEVLAARASASREKLAKERDTMQFARKGDTAKKDIFDKIKAMFRFR